MRDERVGVHGRAIIVREFFPQEIVNNLIWGNWKADCYTDERQAGITSRRKWEMEYMPAHAELMDFIRTNETLKFYVNNFRDLAWKLVVDDEIKTCEMAISKYEPNSGFDWHVDHIESDRGRVLNWLCTLEGRGKVEWHLDPFDGDIPERTYGKILEPNDLLLMPSWYPHRVENVEPRTAFHGHFGI